MPRLLRGWAGLVSSDGSQTESAAPKNPSLKGFVVAPCESTKKILSGAVRTPRCREPPSAKNLVKLNEMSSPFFILLDDPRIWNEDVYKKPCSVNQGLADPYVVLVFTADI